MLLSKLTLDGYRVKAKDEHLRAPKGGVDIKGQHYPGGQFIPSNVDQEEAKKAIEAKKKENEAKSNGNSGESKENKLEKSKEESTTQKFSYEESSKSMGEFLKKIGSRNPISTIPVEGKLTKSTLHSITKNARATLDHYSNYLSTQCYSRARDFIYDMKDLLNNKGFANIDSAHINALVMDSVNKMAYQEVISNRAQFTDHGIRHITGNISRMNDILNATGGKKIKAMDKLMGMFIMVNHDMGYTAPNVRSGGFESVKNSKFHKDYSEDYLREQKSTWNEDKIFTAEQYDKIMSIVKTHDDTKIDKNDLLGTAVRLSDNLALFAKEKLPSMFFYVNKGKDYLIKMGQCAKNNDTKKFEEYRNGLYAAIDAASLDNNLKRDLKAAVKDISYLTPKFTLGVLAGEIESIASSEKGKVNIDIKHNEWDAFLQKEFDMGQSQTKKLLNDYGITDFSQTSYDLGGFITLRVKK